jgi:hypothetical protein
VTDAQHWQLDFARADGFAGFVRLALHPDENVAWFWTYLVGVPDVEGIVVVRDHDVPLPRQGLEIRAEGLWAELWCEMPGEHWTFGLEAFGIRLDGPEDALRPGGEIGERVPIGLDLEWETPDIVHGIVLVGRAQYELDAAGWFYENSEPPVFAGAEIARVIVPEAGARQLVATADGPRWTA